MSEHNDVTAYWNSLYTRKIGMDDTAWMEKCIPLMPYGSSVLDIGCGMGEICQVISTFGHHVIGLDVSEQAIANMHERFPHLSGIVHDMRQPLPFPADHFEVAIASLSLHYFSFDTLNLILCELKRVIRYKGMLIIRMNSVKDPESQKEQPIPRYYFSREQMETLFRDWSLLRLNEKTISYYGKEKVLWECIIDNLKD